MTKNNPSKTLVVVIGMHRSGTSAITRALAEAGVNLGERLAQPMKGVNDKGFWEDKDIVELNEKMLTSLGMTWHTLAPLRETDADALCQQGFLDQATDLLNEKLFKYGLYGFKDPRTAKLLSFWSRVFDKGGFDARYVLALRNPLSVAHSLSKRDGFPIEKGYLLWAGHLLTCLPFIKGKPVVVVEYDQLLATPRKHIHRIADWLGTVPDEQKVDVYCKEFLEKSLRHTQFSVQSVDDDPNAPQLVQDMLHTLFQFITGDISLSVLFLSGELPIWQNEIQRWHPTLTLADTLANHVKNINQVLAKRDRKIESLNQTLVERDRQINAVLCSKSWKITKPLRFVARLYRYGLTRKD